MKDFPFVHLLALIAGGVILFVLKRKYQKIRNIDAIAIFILYFFLIALLTEQGLDLVRKLIDLIQL